VWEALRRLRVYDCELIVLRYLEELLYDEIASILKVSQKTVERHLPHALAKFLHAYERCQRHAIQ
jgi:RNA polymerase sigma factor (sigma-70 family)